MRRLTAVSSSLARGITVVVFAASGATAQAPRQIPPAVQHYFDLIRPVFSGRKAYDQVSFMDQYFRWPGNTGFNASIRRVEDILKSAGYVEESNAKAGAVLTYRIEQRPLRSPAWEPVDASVTIAGEREPALAFATNRNMLAINSFSTPDTGVLAQVVDLGKGTAADYDSVPLRGKIEFAD